VDYPEGFELWRERHAKLLRNVESHQQTRRSRMVLWGRSALSNYHMRSRTAPRVVGEAT
jgi:hypothetical protein